MLHNIYNIGNLLTSSENGLECNKIPGWIVPVLFDANGNFSFGTRYKLPKGTGLFKICEIRNITRHPITAINIEKFEKVIGSDSIKSISNFVDYIQNSNSPERIKNYATNLLNIVNKIQKSYIIKELIELNKNGESELIEEYSFNSHSCVFRGTEILEFNFTTNSVNSQDSELLEWGFRFQRSKNKSLKISDFTGSVETVVTNYEKIPVVCDGAKSKLFSCNNDNHGRYPDTSNEPLKNFNYVIGQDEQAKLNTGFEKLFYSKHNKLCINDQIILYWKQPKEITDDFGCSIIQNYDFDSENFGQLMFEPEQFNFIQLTNKYIPGRFRIINSGTFDILGYSERRTKFYDGMCRDKTLCKIVMYNFPELNFWFLFGYTSKTTKLIEKMKSSVFHGMYKISDGFPGYVVNNGGNSIKISEQAITFIENFTGGNMDKNSLSFNYGRLLYTAASLEEWSLRERGISRSSKFRNISAWMSFTNGFKEINAVTIRNKKNTKKYNDILNTISNYINSSENPNITLNQEDVILGYICEIKKENTHE